MFWTVEGADRNTGEERSIQVEAPDKDTASRYAAQQGMLVSRVMMPPPQIPPVATMAYASPTGNYSVAPDYKRIRVGSSVLNILGIILLALAVVAVVIGFVVMLMIPSRSGENMLFLLAGLGYGIMLAIWGIMLMLGSSVSLAIRDIAQNSFRRG